MCENSLVLKLNRGPYARRMTNREDFPNLELTIVNKVGLIFTPRKKNESDIAHQTKKCD